MEDQRPLASFLEQALSAEIAHRCRRAYVHEIKNGLQPLYSGLEALSRVLRPVEPGSVADKCLTLTRQALAHHEQALERSVSALTGADLDVPQRVDVSALLSELGRFMASDAAFRDVRLNTQSSTSAVVFAPRGLVRLVLLSLLVDCIDSLPTGGELTATTELADDTVVVQFLDTRLPAAAWPPTAAPAVSGDRQLRPAVQMLIARLQGVLEAATHDDARHRLRLSLPRAADGESQ